MVSLKDVLRLTEGVEMYCIIPEHMDRTGMPVPESYPLFCRYPDYVGKERILKKYDIRNTYVTSIKPLFLDGDHEGAELTLRMQVPRDAFRLAMRDVYASARKNPDCMLCRSFFGLMDAYRHSASRLKKDDPEEYRKFMRWFCHDAKGLFMSVATSLTQNMHDERFHESMEIWAEQLNAVRINGNSAFTLYDMPRRMKELFEACGFISKGKIT